MNNTTLKNNNNNRLFLILFTAIILISCIGMYGIKTARANTIKEYEIQISENNERIEQIKSIKNQLHITAELLRAEKTINNGLDSVLSQKWHEYNNHKITLEEENLTLNAKIEKIKKSRRFVGNFKITHYCACSKCNGKYTGTAIGTRVAPGRTIAVDPKVIPLNSKVEIDGYGVRVAEDTGGAIKGNRIDVAVSSHAEAMRLGVKRNVPVYIITE